MHGKGDDSKEKGGIVLDWDKLLPTKTSGGVSEEEEEELVAVVAKVKQENNAAMVLDGDENETHHYEELKDLSDMQLMEAVKRIRGVVDSLVFQKLKDGGKKFVASLKRHELELERRRRRRVSLKEDDVGCKKITPLDISTSVAVDTCDSSREGDPSSRPSSQSKFAALLLNKLDDKIQQTESVKPNAFEKEMSILSPCERRKARSSGQFMSRGGQKRELSTRETPFQSPGNLAGDTEKKNSFDGDEKGRCFSACSPRSADENVSRLFPKRLRPLRGQNSSCRRDENRKHVVLVDEEEPEPMMTTIQENSIGESTNARIYYPSRDDSEAVEISYSDMECLAPEQYLSSTIMNFYIRYLQGEISPSDKGVCCYHCFNTYFYEKLKEAVVCKRMEESSFGKFRRWWKGVNIFEKAYVLLPIHESQHWSLVIICIPDKDNQSGLTVLHLDSLGFHFSNPIFSNIKRFLIEEWKFLKQEGLVDIPISNRVWENLPRRIEEKVVEVPQQRNEYDCGLFVLSFMRKFIVEAPKRLKKEDFAMFGRRWFKPEEASSLRGEISNLLKETFQKNQETEISSGGSP